MDDEMEIGSMGYMKRECRGLKNYQNVFEVCMRYTELQIYKESWSIISVNILAYIIMPWHNISCLRMYVFIYIYIH